MKAFAALPDWSGLWEWDGWTADHSSGEPPEGILAVIRRSQLAAPPPYNVTWQAKDRVATAPAMLEHYANTTKGCRPGFPGQMEGAQLFQLFVMPEETLMLFQTFATRHIYTDGRPHPAKEDLWPTSAGDSVGHWTNDTLIVDTVARKEGTVGSFAHATQLSGRAHFIERIRLLSPNQLEDQMTIEDPIAFTRPWKLRMTYHRVTDVDRLIPFECEENGRNPVVNGKLIIKSP